MKEVESVKEANLSFFHQKINAPQKRLFWIENAGHVADLDNPTEFFVAIKGIIMQLEGTV